MQTQKKMLFISAAVFTLIMIGFTIDFMSKTTRLGKKAQLRERIEDAYLKADSASKDSLKVPR
jgi:hypothetical protein